MTQIGEGVAAGAGKGPKGPELEDNHWLELEYLYQNGSPLYGTYRAIDSEGMEWNGRLNDQGQVCLAGLPEGKVQVDLLPETSDDKALKATRRAIQQVLDQIIADQKAEADEYERDLENLGGPRRVYEHIHKVGESVWNAAVGAIELAETATHKLIEISNFLHPVNLLGDQLKAAYKSYQDGELTREQWYDSINQNLKDEHQKDLARIFGIEPDDLSKERLQDLMALIAEAYDVAAFIADDPETQTMFKQFAKDLAATQHSMEWAEASGALVFELILAALLAVFTGGVGTAAQASTKLRHTAEMRKLAPLFRKLAEQLRSKKLNKQVDVPVDTPTTTKTDQPEAIDLEPKGPIARKRVSPVSLAEAEMQLKKRRQQIAAEGYQPKYSDTELATIAQSGDIGKERFQVRFMEEGYLNDRNAPDEPLSGKMGMVMKTETGEGAKYWSTSFDQIEDADTDPELISQKLGLEYDPGKKYALLIVDSEKAAPLTGVKSVPATFEKVSEFVNTELPKQFPREVTDKIMTTEFQVEYAKHYNAAVESGDLPDQWSRDTGAFGKYLRKTGMSVDQQKLLKKRMNMHDKIGNNQDYLGNGLTKELNPSSSNEFGAVETLNFERKTVELKELDDAGAITVIKDLKSL